MPQLQIETSEGVALRVEIAGAGSRFAATLIDLAWFLCAYVVLVLATLLIVRADLAVGDFVLGAISAGAALSFPLTLAVLHATTDGQTPGKRALGLRLVDVDGQAADGVALALRALLWPIDVLVPLPLPGVIGVAAISLSERRQRLGDRVAGTLVIYDRPARRVSEPFAKENWLELEPKTLALTPGLAARLTEIDRRFLRDLLARPGLPESLQRKLFVAAARHYSRQLELGDFEDARVLLKELYLYLRHLRQLGASGAARDPG